MGFLDYANETHSNIIPKEEFEDLVQQVFGVITENISKSLGPLGSSAMILDGALTEATKDGYQILNSYTFRNVYKRMIYNLFKAPCTKLNNTVGDATTTVITLANAMFDRYKEHKNTLYSLYRLPRTFNQAWDTAVQNICDEIDKRTTVIQSTDYDTIYNLAYVTSNGNKEVSENIAKTYAETEAPSIRLKNSPTNKSYIKAIEGFEFPANLINMMYARNEDGSADEENIYVMIFDHKIESDFFQKVIIPINSVLRAMHKKLLVLAAYYDELMSETIVEQFIDAEHRQCGYINLILAQFPLGKLELKQMTDLAVILKGKVITEDIATKLKDKMASGESVDMIVEKILSDPGYEFTRVIGFAEKANLTYSTGSMFSNSDIKDNDRYQDVLAAAKQDYEAIKASIDFEKQSYAAKIHEAKARIMRLEMKNYIYFIGADSELQKKILWDSIDDVVKCVRSAIRYGIVPGCQITIARSINDLITQLISKYYPNIEEFSDLEDDEKRNVLNDMDINDRLVLQVYYIITAAVGDVYGKVISGPDYMGIVKTIDGWNRCQNDEDVGTIRKEANDKTTQIINESIERNEVFDMETLEFSKNVITSSETDRMVLIAASDLVKILISGNQCIYIDHDSENAEDRTMEVYA